jgi:hypothetical protein
MKEAHLRIDRIAGDYGVSLYDRSFPPEDAVPLAQSPLAAAGLEAPAPTAEDIRRAITSQGPALPLKDIGQRLFTWLDAGGVATRWLAFPGAEPLRTYLDVCDELADLPWEALAVPNPNVDDFLASRPRLRVLRAHARGQIAPIDPDPLVRMLIVVGEEKFDGQDASDLADQEAVNIASALHQRRIHIEVLSQPVSRKAVIDKLKAVRPHILHVMAHGGTAPGSNESALLFRKAGWSWSYNDIYNNIRAADYVPRLVFLNACHSGQGGGATTSVARAVQIAGVPAVIAMQAAVSVPRALIFARAFYRHLAQGEPIDQAMWEARSAVMNAGAGVGANDWVLPMLSVSQPPESVVTVERQSAAVTACVIRQEMYDKGGLFVDRAEERRNILGSVKPFVPATTSERGLVLTEDTQMAANKVGKSWIVKRALGDLVHRGLQVRYCELVGGDRTINYREVLERLRRGEPAVASFAAAPLPDAAFTRYDALRVKLNAVVKAQGDDGLTAADIDDLFASFVEGLKTSADSTLLVLVLDRFVGLPPADFKTYLLPKLLVPILDGAVSNVRFVLVMSGTELRQYGVADGAGNVPLPALRLIRVGAFREADAQRLFVEFCRFTWSTKQAKVYEAWRAVADIPDKGVWSPELLMDWAGAVKKSLPAGEN